VSSDALISRAVAVGARQASIEVSCRCGVAGFTELRHEWNALLPLLANAAFHHHYAWHDCYLHHLARQASAVHFFSFYREGRPIAIFPLRRAVRRVAGIALQVWELPSEAHVDLCDVLIARSEDSARLLYELTQVLDCFDDGWDALCLPKLVEGSIALRALMAAPFSFVRLTRSGTSVHFPCRRAEDVQARLSTPFLRNLRRQRRKLDQQGRVELEMVSEPERLDEALAEFLRIEASGWKGEGGCSSAILLHPALVAFYRELTRRFGADGRCLINLLKLDGRPIAAQYCLVSGARLNLLKIAYDETHAAEAPGNQLLYDVLLRCCASPTFDEVSLVTGPAWASGRWNPEQREVSSAEIFNTTARGMAAFAVARLKPLAAAARALVA
jgi:CelD/BcsL family acetyltransferase involved in cellulose biosynthesis